MKVNQIIKESVTFWIPDAETEDINVDCLCYGGGKIDPTCLDCKGSGVYKRTVSKAPEINLSNSNADMFLTMLGVYPDFAGSWSEKDFPKLRQKIIQLLNTKKIQKNIREPSIDQRPGGPKMIDFGVDEEYLRRRLEQFLELIDYAQKNGYTVTWG